MCTRDELHGLARWRRILGVAWLHLVQPWARFGGRMRAVQPGETPAWPGAEGRLWARWDRRDMWLPAFEQRLREARATVESDMVSGEEVTFRYHTPWAYRDIIQGSRAEFGVAKHGYVATRGGWFSDRTACHLASRRPALVQDCGLSGWLPEKKGMVLDYDLESAVAGINAINADYEAQRRAARSLAERTLATDRVLPPLLETAAA